MLNFIKKENNFKFHVINSICNLKSEKIDKILFNKKEYDFKFYVINSITIVLCTFYVILADLDNLHM